MTSNFFKRANRFPPVIVRMLARVPRGRPLTSLEISQASGIPVARVDSISRSKSWAGIDIYEMQSFCNACSVDFASRVSMKRVDTYIRGARVDGKRVPPSFAYLRKSPDWEKEYLPLIEIVKGLKK